jgi:sporulation protein YlmC with PRC-barrel domain
MMKKASLLVLSAALLATPALAQSNTSSSSTTGSASSNVQFSKVSNNEIFSSNLKGLNVYNQNNESIGEISDVAIGQTGEQVQALILSVGGFLGVGERYVAVSPSSVKVTYDKSNNKWRATMNTNKDELKNAPEFKYPSNKG